MSEQNTASVDDLIWAREMLRTFSKLEKDIRDQLGTFGIEKIVIKSPLFKLLIISSLLINGLGIYLWISEQDAIYVFSSLIPLFSAIYTFKTIREEKRKNIFRFIGKSNHIPIPTLELLLNIVENGIFTEKERFETIIAWVVNQGYREKEKFAHTFEAKTWETIETAQHQCIILAILMVSLQKFLHNNRKTYDEYVRKIPLMNEGYNYKPTKAPQAKKLAPEDINTFSYTKNPD